MDQDPPNKAVQAAARDAAHLTDAAPDLSDPGTPLSHLAPSFAPPPPPKSAAALACERIIHSIRAFEQHLNADQEVALGSAGSEAGIVQIEGLGYFDPDLITFYGRDESGMKTQLIQHVSQLSVMLRAIPKPIAEEPARRIGFRLMTGWTGGDSGDASA